jgi:hypothetical protein
VEGAKLENRASIPDPYEAIARATRRDSQQEFEL